MTAFHNFLQSKKTFLKNSDFKDDLVIFTNIFITGQKLVKMHHCVRNLWNSLQIILLTIKDMDENRGLSVSHAASVISGVAF